MLVFELMEYLTKARTTLAHAWLSYRGELPLVDKYHITVAIILGS